MAASSSSYVVQKIGPKVFINFRGKDVRKDFVCFLYDSLKKKIVNAYIDEDEIRGLPLDQLFVRIEESKIALAIFSKEYTNSEWCLDELVKIMERVDQGKLHVIPIFYKIETSAVTDLSGEFGDNFRKKVKEFKNDLSRTQKWQEALASAPQTFGLPLSEQSDTLSNAFIEKIVEEVQKLIKHISTVENANQPEANRHSLMKYARQLKIEWSELSSCWTFMSVSEEPNGEAIEVAKMNVVWFLNVAGFFHTKDLTPGTKYEVVFVVKVEDTFSEWDTPAKLLLMVPHGNEQQEQELSFDGYVRNEWVNIRAGVFVAPPQSKKITFTLLQHETDEPKTGLQIKGVAVRPTE